MADNFDKQGKSRAKGGTYGESARKYLKIKQLGGSPLGAVLCKIAGPTQTACQHDSSMQIMRHY